jgi:chromosome partitioning protein
MKGGSAKTTTAFNLGAALARRGRRVLLVDLDPQASLTLLSQADVKADARTVYPALVEDNADLSAIVLPSPHGVDVLPGTPRLERLRGAGTLGDRGDVALASALTRLRGHYDHVVVDCPPDLGALTATALAAADRLLVPAPCDSQALLGLLKLVQLARRFPALRQPDGLRLLPSIFDSRAGYEASIREQLTRHFPGQVLDLTVRRTVRIKEAAEQCLPIADLDPRNDAAAVFAALAEAYDRD